jgi:asparagine N-glycosylation enzyme membrane subunit Stt3
MTTTLIILFWLSGFAIFYAMIGYPLVLILLDKLLKPKEHDRDYAWLPSVTVMIVAHNRMELPPRYHTGSNTLGEIQGIPGI